ncbi:hypothetical protein [Microbacterium allomyrinae]|jgi:hypothetical protein|uniref:Uncharacterized protein n=1 Tax=Microbacterium allomyrinae TaxID=2830666 RepID=A0A9X1S3W9_9MICO|nr:hypothetical protein [Microbacterium allomyrinae]MCC2032428.1 hypothetical protein [Microbacterium allomyrinae]
MDGSTLILADRLSRERAAALDLEQRIRLSVVDRGIVITPARPVVDALVGLGMWLRSALNPPRPRYV